MEQKKHLLSIMELGGYPDFNTLYQDLGFQVEMVDSMRKAVRSLKNNKFDVIIAEFNFQSDFRDRTSSLEILMAVIQQIDNVKVIIFYEKEYKHQFDKLRARFSYYSEIAYPIDKQKLSAALKTI